MFHVVTAGRCWLEIADGEPRLLQLGDLGLVPHGEGHRLVSEPGVPGVELMELPRVEVSDRYEVIHMGGGGAATNLVCGTVRFDHPAAEQLVSLLPGVISVEAWSSPEMEWIASTLRFMAAEAREPRLGGETVITRLADILVIQAIRVDRAGPGCANGVARGAAGSSNRSCHLADPPRSGANLDGRLPGR
jgi:hypothetical protein